MVGIYLHVFSGCITFLVKLLDLDTRALFLLVCNGFCMSLDNKLKDE